MRSMTGFGVGDAAFGESDAKPSVGRVSIEIRAVNHRYLDLRVRGPSAFPDVASAVEALAREKLTRGRFDITVRFDGPLAAVSAIDRERLRIVYRTLQEIRDEIAPGADVPLSLLAAIPDLFSPSIEAHSGMRAALATAFDATLGSLDRMRRHEGALLAKDLLHRLERVRELAKCIALRSPLAVEGHRKRLEERAERLRSTSKLELDAARLEQEVVLFADRIDVAEEVTRLDGHVTHFGSLVAEQGAIGRRLDFLLQEMAREANTIGAKCQDGEIAHAVVDLKAEIDRMREQAQNVE